MKQEFFEVSVSTPGKSLTDISELIQREVTSRSFHSGLLTIWCAHTGASLLVQANADPDVQQDILDYFEKLVPKSAGAYRHKPDEDDNAPSHLRALLTQTQLSIPIYDGLLPMGKVQSLYLFEHREAPKIRRLNIHYLGT
ncbi:secondary thiamine-phosphate synthase enzyme YjbQ [Ruegeria arenilitoris]|uniref:secondary thiamine-phosphate synthase enzyme YjbQ n=1 Tax=Ruegeria arenilitoris TaxID=1173585 RepID=UPI00148012C5|nr:secondary thiamine-phosphate synthase enzyme YjbQ [Ruegeria arenilitoris]